jgi:protein SCO1/2
LLPGAADRAGARPTLADYNAAVVQVPPGATLPSATVLDERGTPHDVRNLISGPTVLVFADYTCRTLCGPTVAFVAAVLEKTGLRAGEQFRLIAVSFNPADTPASAVKMRQAHLGDSLAANGASDFLVARPPAIRAMTSALGYHYSYDRDSDQFVHPAATFVLDRRGRVVRVLDGVALSQEDMRLALVEASEGRVGTFRDQIRLICSAFDPVHGAYNLAVSRLLFASGAATVVTLGTGIGLLLLAGRRGRA